ncbi:MAG: hypothetical protein SPD98_01355 [Tractidigestivibacter sp.]|nr:hypothetical protein [Tractidigestivibacter sp.]
MSKLEHRILWGRDKDVVLDWQKDPSPLPAMGIGKRRASASRGGVDKHVPRKGESRERRGESFLPSL